MNFKTVLTATAIMALACFSTGCGNACDDLADKLEECGVDTSDAGDSDAECTDEAEAAAECLTGCLDDNDCGKGDGYLECVTGCN